MMRKRPHNPTPAQLLNHMKEWSTKQPNGCLEWNRSPTPYGQIIFNRKLRRIHRLAWELLIGPIPIGMQVLHKCNNPRCWNTDHLYLGTHQDNMRDKYESGRFRRELKEFYNNKY